jgi:pimeloyl-ACP methyl ester carboxylesterase
VIVPYLRGYGTTRFLSSETFRNGQQSVVAVDIIALMDALKIKKAILAGYDWGARTADIMAALWPERCKALVSVSGYLITNLNRLRKNSQRQNSARIRPNISLKSGTARPQICGVVTKKSRNLWRSRWARIATGGFSATC